MFVNHAHYHFITFYLLVLLVFFASCFCTICVQPCWVVSSHRPLVPTGQFGIAWQPAKASAGAMSLQYCRDHGRNSLSRFLRKITIDMSNLDAQTGCTNWMRCIVPLSLPFVPKVGKSEGYTFRHWRRHQRATRHLQLWTPRNLGYIYLNYLDILAELGTLSSSSA